jgi:hypothetical protein
LPTLREILEQPDVRPRAVAACLALLDAEVEGKRGLTGAAIRTAYGFVGRLRPGIMRDAVDLLLPEFADALQPFFSRAAQERGPEETRKQAFMRIVAQERDAVGRALLEVTDRRVRETRSAVQTAYGRLRGVARDHVEAAIPGLAKSLADVLP